MTRGILVTFEGIDGCGKSTQVELLRDRMLQNNIDHIVVREPGGTAVGESTRQILLNNQYSPSLQSEIFLYMAARSDLTNRVIRPALNSGKLVICDRFTDSTLAYQGFGGGADLEMIRNLSNIATGGIVPDLTFLLDLPVEDAVKRRGASADRMESKDIRFHQRVRSGYLEIARSETGRFKILNALSPVEDLGGTVLHLIEDLIETKKSKRLDYEL